MYALNFFLNFPVFLSTGESCFLIKIHYFGGLYIVDLCRFTFQEKPACTSILLAHDHSHVLQIIQLKSVIKTEAFKM